MSVINYNGSWLSFGGNVLTPEPQPITPDFDAMLLDLYTAEGNTGAVLSAFTIADRYNTEERYITAIQDFNISKHSGYTRTNEATFVRYTEQQLANINTGGGVTGFEWSRLVLSNDIRPTLFKFYYRFMGVLNPAITVTLTSLANGSSSIIAIKTIQPENYSQYVDLMV